MKGSEVDKTRKCSSSRPPPSFMRGEQFPIKVEEKEIALSILCFGAAASLYDRCLQGKFVAVTGTCSEIERVPLRRRIKALYLRNDRHYIKLMGVRRIKNLVVGDSVTIYIADDAAVYEIEGYQVVCNYLAIEKRTKVQRGKSAQPID